MWIFLMLVILLTTGMSSFGLQVLSEEGFASEVKYPYLTIWYAAGFLCLGVSLLGKRTKGGWKEMMWGGALAVCSMGGQVAMANALAAGLPGSIVFPVTTGGSILFVALAAQLLFSEQLHAFSWAGVALGLVAVVLLSLG
jgi:multidrug transporter EmrE-like cation transporter